jgi:hypothetical protein
VNQAIFTAGAQAGIRVPPYLPPPNLLSEDFASGLTPSGWTVDAATPNFAYQPSIEGRNSLGLVNTNAKCRAAFAATTDVRAYFKYAMMTQNTIDHRIADISSGATYGVKLEWLFSTKRMQVADTGGITFASPVIAINLGTVYHIWIHYLAGSGANATISLGIADSPVEPTSGNGYAQMTNGVSTLTPDRIQFWAPAAIDTTQLFDRVGVSTLTMPNGW